MVIQPVSICTADMRRMEGKQEKKKDKTQKAFGLAVQWWHVQNHTSDGTMQVKAVRRPLPQHSGPRPLVEDGVLKYRWWLKQKIWIGHYSVTPIENSRVFLYVSSRSVK